MRQIRNGPGELNVRNARNEHDIERSFPDDLEGDRDIATECVARFRDLHTESVRRNAGRRNTTSAPANDVFACSGEEERGVRGGPSSTPPDQTTDGKQDFSDTATAVSPFSSSPYGELLSSRQRS